MRTLLSLLAAALLTAFLLPAAAGAATPKLPCVDVLGVTTCPENPAPAPTDPAACEGADEQPTVLTLARARTATLCLLNVERAKAGVAALKASPPLRGAATGFARRMARDDFFGHVGPSGDTLRDRVRRTSYLDGARRWSLGENIAWGGGERSTPAQIVDSWMHSDGHRRNLLDKSFQNVGIGVSAGLPVPGVATGGTYVTDFGSRR